MNGIYVVILCVVVFAGAFALALWINNRLYLEKKRAAEAEAERMLAEAKKTGETTAREARLQVRDEQYQLKRELEEEVKGQRDELKKEEKRILERSGQLDRKADSLERRENETSKKERRLAQRTSGIEAKEKKCDLLMEEQKKKLEEISGCSAGEAKARLMERVESEARFECAKLIKRIENEAREQCDKKSKEIICTAIQRYAGDYVAEKTVSVVNLPSDEMKGRIIGREGRNIRAIEAATGIDLIIDDTPEAVVLSGFNPVRREVARLSLERLIVDGRIHPARIEAVVKEITKELDGTMREAGERAAFDLGVHGIHSDLIYQLGKLKFRTSYAQNVLQHSIEVGFLAGIMADELGMNLKMARRAGLLHDIGKAVDHEAEGSHAVLGARLAKKCGEPPEIVHAIEAHHEDVPPESILAVLVQASDALSGARPGARREMLETYVKRLQGLEKIANSYQGIKKSYAIQAGRELRILVESDRISDEEATLLSRDVARNIEESMTYPGQIKVTVIRETRAVEHAK
ncbi:MAG: ribonuclease Y [Desulfobacteria bacterium]